MNRGQPIRLRQSQAPAPKPAKIIDAQFQVIGRRTIWDRIWIALVAVFWAAVIGFAIPQLWILSQRMSAYLGGG